MTVTLRKLKSSMDIDSDLITDIFIVTVIGGLISLFLQLSIQGNPKIFKPIGATITGSIISAIGTTTFFLAHDLTRLREQLNSVDNYLIETDVYFKAVKAIDTMDRPLAKKPFEEQLRDIEKSLSNIANEKKEILLRKDQILDTWEHLVKNAKSKILATNLVDFSDWNNVSRDKAGIAIQQSAIERGVKITRINIYDETNKSHEDGLNILREHQDKIGVTVHSISLQYIDAGGRYDSIKQELGGTLDVVIVDDEVVLLTTVDSKTYKMERSKLTYNPRTVETASKLFNKLLGGRE